MTKHQELQLVQMKVSPKTLEILENLKQSMQEDNRSKIIRESLELTNTMINTIKSGGKVIIEEKNGERSRVILPGISTNTM